VNTRRLNTRRRRALAGLAAVLLGGTGCASAAVHTAAAGPATSATAPAGTAGVRPYLLRFHSVTRIASTVPANGDVNPYGVAVVRQTAGKLVRGDILVSNFNSKANVQGTGTTIVEVSPGGEMRPFARLTALPSSDPCPGGIGLTTGLAVLPGGWVAVGSLPTVKGGRLPATNPVGCIIVLNSHGKPVETWTNTIINGPWDMTMRAESGHASLFISNVLSRAGGPHSPPPPSGECTVVRLDISLAAGSRPRMTGVTTVASGFPWRPNKAALIQGPTGLALGRGGTLYVVSTIGNSISAVPDALTRTSPAQPGTGVLTSGGALNGPLGLTLAPNGDVIAVNGNNGKAIEVTPQGRQSAVVTLVRHGAGDLFGVTPAGGGRGLFFVNDGTNALDQFGS
jgi:hypothetical protein